MIMLRDYKLFTFIYSVDMEVRESVVGTGEVRRTGSFVRETREWRCVTSDQEMAEFLFEKRVTKHSFNKNHCVLEIKEDSIDVINLSHTS